MQRHNSPPSRKLPSRKLPYRKLIECQGEFGFAAVAADQVEGAVVCAHYLAGEAQADAGAVAFGCEERYEDLFLSLGRDG